MKLRLKRFSDLVVVAATCLLITVQAAGAAPKPRTERRQLGLPLYTTETEHFKINYQEGLQHMAKRIGCMLEELHEVYTESYSLYLPKKTEVLVSSTEENYDNFASSNTNLISISVNDFEYNLRGSGNYLRDVVAHEFAHIISINSGLKAPGWLLGVQVGRFSHPNSGTRTDAMHLIPFESLPPWFFEGIAQFESSQMGGDRWDTHRDMILRTLTLNHKLLSWDRMSVFSGRGDDYEKTYNHGFSLVSYIAETYGRNALVGIMRESSRMLRMNFDRSIERALGISARDLNQQWRESLKRDYQKQLDELGTQVFGRKLNKHGFDVRWPRFSHNDSTIFFISNGKQDYTWKKLSLYSYLLNDTLDDDKRIRSRGPSSGSQYDIHDSTMVFSTMASPRSRQPWREGGRQLKDLAFGWIVADQPGERPAKPPRTFRKKHKHPITEKQSLFAAAFSPRGDRLAALQHDYDRFYLCLLDTTGKNVKRVFPTPRDTTNIIQTMYSVDWSPDGHHIAFSYVENFGDRKIALYDTLSGKTTIIADTEHDERDPRFSADGKRVYFASDRSGIFNIYRFDLESQTLEQLTNVAGGAFQPDISEDESRLVYINYDAEGYGVYLIDSIQVVKRFSADSTSPAAAARRCGDTRTVFSSPTRYNRFPRQFLLVPTIFGEETVTEQDNVHKGVGVLKAGAIMYLFDPFSWIRGNEIGAYFFVEPSKLFQFFDSKNIINPKVNYDFGIFGGTNYLPFSLNAEYLQRGIAGEDVFYSASGELLHLDYNLSPRWFNIWGSKQFPFLPFKISGVASYNWYNVHLFVREYPRSAFVYSAAKGYRVGAYLNHVKRKTDRLFGISPRGRAVKIAYDFYGQKLQDEEEPFDSEWHVNSNDYTYHQISASLKWGWKMPWSKKQRMYLDAWGTAVTPTNTTQEKLKEQGRDPNIPSFYEPIGWLPGYTYYYRYDTITAETGQDSIVDTVLLSGNAVSQLKLSYRFPLWPQAINKKLGFIFFEHLYGAVNAYAGAAWHSPSEALDWNRNDWLTAIGAEIRLEAQSFYRYPLAISLRWDRGLDKPAPVGGDRYSLTIGFSFDDWGLLDYPDHQQAPRGSQVGRRFRVGAAH